jgi:hypothetical protein
MPRRRHRRSANPKYLKGATPRRAQDEFNPRNVLPFVYEMKFLLMRRVDKARVCVLQPSLAAVRPTVGRLCAIFPLAPLKSRPLGRPAGEVCSDARVDQNSRTVVWTDTARAAALLFAAGTVSALAPAAAYTSGEAHCDALPISHSIVSLAKPKTTTRRQCEISLVRLESENAHATRDHLLGDSRQ